MKFASALTKTDKDSLTHLRSNGPTHRQRQRAQAVLLSAKGYTMEQIADVLDTGRPTVSVWFHAWREQGLGGLADAPKSGGPRKIDAALEAELADFLQHPTPDLKALLQTHLKKKESKSPGTP